MSERQIGLEDYLISSRLGNQYLGNYYSAYNDVISMFMTVRYTSDEVHSYKKNKKVNWKEEGF